MTILDRYIARQFLVNVATLFVILFSFVVVIDVSLNIERFINRAVELQTSGGGAEPGLIRKTVVTALVIADLWWPRLLQLFNFMLGLVMVAAMGFTCTQLSRHREFLAMLAAGLSLHRVARPILAIALGLTFVQAINQEMIIPRIAPLLARDHGDAGKRGLGQTPVPLTPDGQGWIYRADSFDADAGVLTGVYILERDETTKQAIRQITATRATWNDGGWDLEDGLEQYIRRSDTALRDEKPRRVHRVETALDPATLKMNRYREYRNALSFSQAGHMLKKSAGLDPQTRRDLSRVRWGRISMMLSALLTLVIATPFFVTRVPGNMLLQSLKCAPISIGALVLGVLGSSAALPGIPPWLGAFLPVMALSTIAVAMISLVKT
ncbi:MAG: LptF/LptG family permease [Phycisphaerales bacterium]